MTATARSRNIARAASRHNCSASQNTLATVISSMSACAVKSRLTLMLPATGLPSAAAAMLQIGCESVDGTPANGLQPRPEQDGWRTSPAGRATFLMPIGWRLAAHQDRDLVGDGKARKQDRVHAPGEKIVAAVPEWSPSEARGQPPDQGALDGRLAHGSLGDATHRRVGGRLTRARAN